jgi:methylamine dehydrogenase heavy chain
MPSRLLPAMSIAAVLGLAPSAAGAADFPDPLPVEASLRVVSLPKTYPTSWAFTNSVSKIELIDTEAKPLDHVRGQLGGEQFGNLQLATTRPEVYVAETFYSRGVRGDRTDVVTIYDSQSLAPTGEIVLGGPHRYLSVTQPNAFQLTNDETLGLVFDFTPAASVKVLDLARRTVVGETPIPGCALIYPTGQHSFSSLCATGTMLTVRLDAAGHVAGQQETRAFNDLDHDPLFSLPARIGRISYFTSFKGMVQPIDLAGDAPVLAPAWPLVTAQEAAANWRPSGWQQAAGGGDGRLYVIMQPNGHDGSHKDGGDQVWVFDVATHAKVATIKLKTPARSIALTDGAKPVLLAAAGPPDNPLAASLDAYDTSTGAQLNSLPIDGLGGTPVIFPIRR